MQINRFTSLPVNMATRLLVLVTLFVFCNVQILYSQNSRLESPVIGAQVIIEPGQTPEEIDNWFRILSENGMKTCRIRMFEVHMHKSDGSWDYSHFDIAFKAAEKYGITVFATLFPIANDKFPDTNEHLIAISNYIQNVVLHFKKFKSLYAWVLINEPGVMGKLPVTEFTSNKFKEWKNNQTIPSYRSKGFAMLESFDNERFLLEYNTWFLSWLADEVKRNDPNRHLHVNNHLIFENIAEYNFPEWRKFLTTLGASAHPSWHFGYFKREQYTVAMSVNCDIIRSGAGELPFWVTELQGGNNTYSGFKGFCPTKDEITQWLWTSIGSGAKGIIFWCLNPRSLGGEAGEWALLNFQNEASDRLIAAKELAKTIDNNVDLFSSAIPYESGVNILYTRESLWIEKRVQTTKEADTKDYEGRMTGGVMKSALAYYEALIENGINSNFKEISEFDWNRTNYSGETIILANQISIPSQYWEKLSEFVSKGGKLIVDGLTAFYDENMLSLMNTGFPLEKLLGGSLKEVVCMPGDFKLQLNTLPLKLSGHLWRGDIRNISGNPIIADNSRILGLQNKFGKGETVWIPSMIGMGARRSNNKFLSEFLRTELKENYQKMPVQFTSQQKGVSMRTMESGKSFITILINKSKKLKRIGIDVPNVLQPDIIFMDKSGKTTKRMVCIPPEGTMVVLWK